MDQRPGTIAECLDWGEAHMNPKIRNDAKLCRHIIAFRGLNESDLETLPASVKDYLTSVGPRYRKTDRNLLRDLETAALSHDSYKQYQRGGKRLIEAFTGEADKRKERASRSDGWFDLEERLTALVDAGLEPHQSFASFTRLKDNCRKLEIDVRDLHPDYTEQLKEVCYTQNEWSSVKKAIGFLDRLRQHRILLDFLPPKAFGAIDQRWRRHFAIPDQISGEINNWVDIAARTQVPKGYEKHSRPLSKKSRDAYRAALRNYVSTAQELGEGDLSYLDTAEELFTKEIFDDVLEYWIALSGQPGSLSFRSISSYVSKIRLTLTRTGRSALPEYILGVEKVNSALEEGRNAGERMSPKVEKWCTSLVVDDNKIETFETQHHVYFKKAKAALREAKREGFRLQELIQPEAMRKLPDTKRRRARKILRRAKLFGTLAAYAAIELEGAPFRKTNTLNLEIRGKDRTLFDHSTSTDPFFEIQIPNKFLKNGEYLTQRGEELPPIQIRSHVAQDLGVDILSFFLREIRPLFLGANRGNKLFPANHRKTNALSTKTFDLWLMEGSTELGIPMTSHNFRHGYVSIQYNDDPNCLSDVAIILGDKVDTLRKYYAFLDKRRTVQTLQRDISKRRAARRVPEMQPV
ncbi:hypothetical protein FIU89_15450 [Roseovarius sp. THAF27]|uniref:hypothetical protein n=1 Tax=Roseovarius sp. THAF27 TaxID=2587850 RepID=UPI0012690CAC|nr:hypothetical protein [Roseovarius sp. THAF27]QFT82020.1 hypothetical protein FIU89_15450 [Roseovarius sp. THAF27]